MRAALPPLLQLFPADPIFIFLSSGRPEAVPPLATAMMDLWLVEATPTIYQLADYGCAAWVKTGKPTPTGLLRWVLPLLARSAALLRVVAWLLPPARPLLDFLGAAAPDRRSTAVQASTCPASFPLWV